MNKKKEIKTKQKMGKAKKKIFVEMKIYFLIKCKLQDIFINDFIIGTI